MESVVEKFRELQINGCYRGVVLDNTGDYGKCKIFVPTVYNDQFAYDPKSLPWAEPAMPFFGGSYQTLPSFKKNDVKENTINRNQTGVNTVPKIGAHVWVFFEGNNHNYPVYFAAIQGSPGWMAEHQYQSVYKSDNILLRIDEHPELTNKKLVTDQPEYFQKSNEIYDTTKMIKDPTQITSFYSTSFFNSFNSTNIETVAPKPTVEQKMPTRVQLDITGNVQLIINGNVNLLVGGNAYVQYCGNVYETTLGDKYEKIKGNYYLEVDKDFKELIGGVHEETVNGMVNETYKQKQYTKVTSGIKLDTPMVYATNKVEISTSLDVTGYVHSSTVDAVSVTAATVNAGLLPHFHAVAIVPPATVPAAISPGTGAGVPTPPIIVPI